MIILNNKISEDKSDLQVNFLSAFINQYVRWSKAETTKQEDFYYDCIYRPVREGFLEMCPFGQEASHLLYQKGEAIDLYEAMADNLRQFEEVIRKTISKCQGLYDHHPVEVLVLPLVSRGLSQGVRDLWGDRSHTGSGENPASIRPKSRKYRRKTCLYSGP